MSDEAINNLAVKIARLLQTDVRDADFLSLQKSVEKISERLESIEISLNNQNASGIQYSAFSRNSYKHPSQEKFDVAEVINNETSESTEAEKPCPYEPTGKPCDHCSMCSSRGF